MKLTPGARLQAAEAAIQHAVAVKINLSAIGRFQKPIVVIGLQHTNRGHRPLLVLLHLPLHQPDIVLQHPAGTLERIVDREYRIAVALILMRRTSDIDLMPTGQLKMDSDFIRPAASTVRPPFMPS